MPAVFLVWCSLIVGIIVRRGYSGDFHDIDQEFSIPVTRDSTLPEIAKIGFYSQDITPVAWESWNDRNSNGLHEPDQHEEFADSNHNGIFDAIYCGGDDTGKPIRRVKSKLNLTACVMSIGDDRWCIVNYDGYGINDRGYSQLSDFLRKNHRIDLLLLVPNLNYHSPDLIGWWNRDAFGRPRINQDYWSLFKTRLYVAVDLACERLSDFQVRVSSVCDQDQGYLFLDLMGSTLGQFVISHTQADTIDHQAYISSAWYGVQRNKARRAGIDHTLFFNQWCTGSRLADDPKSIDWMFDTLYYQPAQPEIEVFCNTRSVLIPVHPKQILTHFINGSSQRPVYRFSALTSQVTLMKIDKSWIMASPVRFSTRRINRMLQRFDDKENIHFLAFVNDQLGDYPGNLIQHRNVGMMIEKLYWDMMQNYFITYRKDDLTIKENL